MSMKPGCVIYNPEGKSWCVLVESTMDDGTVRRFMSFHKTLHDARLTQQAHADVNEGTPTLRSTCSSMSSLRTTSRSLK